MPFNRSAGTENNKNPIRSYKNKCKLIYLFSYWITASKFDLRIYKHQYMEVVLLQRYIRRDHCFELKFGNGFSGEILPALERF